MFKRTLLGFRKQRSKSQTFSESHRRNTNQPNQSSTIQTTPINLSDSLSTQLLDAMKARCARGETCGPSELLHDFGFSPSTQASDLQTGLNSDSQCLAGTRTAPLKISTIDELICGDKIIIPGSIITELMRSKTPFTQNGFRLRDAIIDGDLSLDLEQWDEFDPSQQSEFSAKPDDFDGVIEKHKERKEKAEEEGDNYNIHKEILEEHGIETFIPVITRDKLSIAHHALPCPGLYFLRCKIEDAGIIAPNILVKGNIVFKDCMFEYIYLQNAQIHGDLILENTRLFRHPLQKSLRRWAETACPDTEENVIEAYKKEDEGEMHDPGLEPRASLQAAGINVSCSVHINDTLLVSGANLDRAKIGGAFRCYGSHFQCYKHPYEIAALSLDVADIGGSVWLAGDREDRHDVEQRSKPEFDLPIRKTSNNLSSDPTLIHDDPNHKSADNRARLFCALGGVNMRSTKIGGSLYCYGTIFVPYAFLEKEDLLTKPSNNDPALIKREYDFVGATQEFDSSLRCAGINVKQDVKLDRNFVGLGILDFSSSRIGRQFDFRAYPWRARIQVWPSFSLRNAKLICSQHKDTQGTWEKPQTQRLDHFSVLVGRTLKNDSHPEERKRGCPRCLKHLG